MNNGENDLDKLLRTLRPVLAEDKYVYCHEASSQDEVHEDEAEWHALRAAELKELDPFVSVKEAEGLTMVLREEEARRAGFDCAHTFRCITLQVHSSLHAVGLTAAVSAELARNAVSANVIAGFFHDHVLVPSEQAEAALKHLENLSLGARS